MGIDGILNGLIWPLMKNLSWSVLLTMCHFVDACTIRNHCGGFHQACTKRQWIGMERVTHSWPLHEIIRLNLNPGIQILQLSSWRNLGHAKAVAALALDLLHWGCMGTIKKIKEMRSKLDNYYQTIGWLTKYNKIINKIIEAICLPQTEIPRLSWLWPTVLGLPHYCIGFVFFELF